VEFARSNTIDFDADSYVAGGTHFAIAKILSRQIKRSPMSPCGPSRHFATTEQFGRFRREADVKWLAGPAGSVAIDPQETWATFN
jgi:hypothetical protein